MTHLPAQRAVLITGGAQRLGRAMVLGFARDGWDIALHYHCSDVAASALQGQVQGMGQKCVLLRADLEKPENAHGLIEEAFTALPHLYALVNNASRFPAGTLAETDAHLLERMMALHVHSPILLSKAFAERNPQARVVMMADSNVTRTQQGHFAYLLSKQALVDATRMLARALAPEGRVNAICPGAILAELGGDESYMAARAAQIPLKANASVEDIVITAICLATQGPLTGQIMYVDGGEHLL